MISWRNTLKNAGKPEADPVQFFSQKKPPGAKGKGRLENTDTDRI
jgi:hypothetical protein